MKFFTLAVLAANAIGAFAAPSPIDINSLVARNNSGGNGGGNGSGKKYVRLRKEDAALLVIDHQTGLSSMVRDIEPADFKTNVLAFSDIGKQFQIPVVLTTSRDDGPNGPMVQQILDDHPNAPLIKRPGQINAWDNEEFVAAVKATGKKQLIVSGIVTEVCVAFMTLSAIEAGYEVFVVTDASGTFNDLVREASWSRMEQAGAQLMSFFAVACELAIDWRTDLEGLTAFFTRHVPEYADVIASYQGTVAAISAAGNSTS